METIPHDQLVMKGVLNALSKATEPLTAVTYFDPTEPLIPYSDKRRGRFNVEGKILQILDLPLDHLATLTPSQARAILADGLLGSSALQRGFLSYFDSDRFGLKHRTGVEVARILNNPNRALADRAGEVANLAELVSGYSAEDCDRIKPIEVSTSIIISKLLMAATARYQNLPMYTHDIRYMANFTARAVIRNVTVGLPPHITEIACWAANELQLAGEDGKISGTIADPATGTYVDVKSELFFLPLLVDLEGNPLTVEYLRDYTLKGWERPTSSAAIARDTKRIMAMVAEKRRQIKEVREY